ncbi:hypothetical protein LRB11_16930, partial [Ectothiorhodospira haloalkaliphila]|uniref:hypothetical protein n=1 Tax=Ectothiorhodospira haloalkaliphila TaxID=421628 RepID=UPI001EE8D15F
MRAAMTPSIKARHVYTRDKDLTVAAGWYLLALGAVGEPQSPWGRGTTVETFRAQFLEQDPGDL